MNKTIMELWSKATGTIKKKIAIPVNCDKNGKAKKDSKFVNLHLSQWVNDKSASKATRIGLGDTGKSLYFAGNTNEINRIWGLKPLTREEARAKEDGNWLDLWNPAEGNTPQSFEIEDTNGTITLRISSRLDVEEDMQHIVIELGDTGLAIEISPVKNTLRQTEVSMPFAYERAPEIEQEVETINL